MPIDSNCSGWRPCKEGWLPCGNKVAHDARGNPENGAIRLHWIKNGGLYDCYFCSFTCLWYFLQWSSWVRTENMGRLPLYREEESNYGK